MRIYSMTATFGKLENSTLTLTPGLNVVQAPNEWGKSTWCAFLLAMFYGLDRSKGRRSALADKERYTPWSGSSLGGRVDLQWQGRDITIERTTRGRIPMGQFRAYETATGLPVPELTGENCGEMLLGAEQSVYRRAGFIRFQDLPVTQDEALRRRLQSLVTTGEDSTQGDHLEEKLKELKNRVRYNRTGLLPQAEAEKASLEGMYHQRLELDEKLQQLESRLEDLNGEEAALRNHAYHLRYRRNQAALLRQEAARQELKKVQARVEELEAATALLPPPEQIREKRQRLRDLQARESQLRDQLIGLPEEPSQEPFPEPYQVPNPEEMVEQDLSLARRLDKQGGICPILTALALIALAGILMAARYRVLALVALALAAVLLALGAAGRIRCRRGLRRLEEKYATANRELWRRNLEHCRWLRQQQQQQRSALREHWYKLEEELQSLDRLRASLCGAQQPRQVDGIWQEALQQWQELEAVRREAALREENLGAFPASSGELPAPEEEDRLSCSWEDTQTLLADVRQEQQRLAGRLGQLRGRGEVLPSRRELQHRIREQEARITRLEDSYGALTIALETLAQTRRELQQRFAPAIVRGASEMMEGLTSGRYQRLSLDQDFSLAAGAAEESGLSSILWRSDGTVDQLYLALRLAVARELTPQAPLVLDDALIRFDDTRLREALKLLKRQSREKQVILFTCQEREKRMLEE